MLINSLFLFLRDLLPLFFFCSILIVFLAGGKARNMILAYGLILGSVSALLVSQFDSSIASFASGNGFEIILFTSTTLQTLLLLLTLCTANRVDARLVAAMLTAMLALISLTSGLNFLIYFSSYWGLQGLTLPMIFGVVIGAGLSLSLAILLYFLLQLLREYAPLLSLAFPVLFISGHFAEVFHILEQMNVLESQLMWSTQSWLPEQSEITLILASLTGYEATPTRWQLIAYLCALASLLACLLLRRRQLLQALSDSEHLS